MKEFANQLCRELIKKINKEYQVVLIRSLEENDGGSLYIYKEGECVNESFTIPVKSCWETCKRNGKQVWEMALSICSRINDLTLGQKHVIDRIMNFGWAKDKIQVAVINYEKNSEQLKRRPHRRFLDLAIVYYLELEDANDENCIAHISEGLLKAWSIDEEDLYHLAMYNMNDQNLFELISASEMGFRMINEFGKDLKNEEMILLLNCALQYKELGMYAGSNVSHRYGASYILNTRELQKLADKEQCDLIIYPSSTHEILIQPYKDGESCVIPVEQVKEINASLDEQDVLSDNIYFFKRNSGKVCIWEEK